MPTDDASESEGERREGAETPLLAPAGRHRFIAAAIVVLGAALALWRCG